MRGAKSCKSVKRWPSCGKCCTPSLTTPQLAKFTCVGSTDPAENHDNTSSVNLVVHVAESCQPVENYRECLLSQKRRLKNSRGVPNEIFVFFCLSFLGFCRICVQCLLQGRSSKRDAYRRGGGLLTTPFVLAVYGHPATGKVVFRSSSPRLPLLDSRVFHGTIMASSRCLSLVLTMLTVMAGLHHISGGTWELKAIVLGLLLL